MRRGVIDDARDCVRGTGQAEPDPGRRSDTGPPRGGRRDRRGRHLRHRHSCVRRRVRGHGLSRSCPGHEATGTIVAARWRAVNDGVFDFAVGDHVAINPSQHLTASVSSVRTGTSNLCRFWNGLGVVVLRRRLRSSSSPPPLGNVYKLRNPTTDLYQAALIEPLACSIRGWDVLPAARSVITCSIYGAGTMGLIMAQLAPRAGAASVSIVDLNEAPVEGRARTCGVETSATPTADQADRDKWDVVIDCTGQHPGHRGRAHPGQAGRLLPELRCRPGRREERRLLAVPDLSRRDQASSARWPSSTPSAARSRCSRRAPSSAKAMISHSFTLWTTTPKPWTMFRAGTGRKLQIRPERHGIAGRSSRIERDCRSMSTAEAHQHSPGSFRAEQDRPNCIIAIAAVVVVIVTDAARDQVRAQAGSTLGAGTGRLRSGRRTASQAVPEDPVRSSSPKKAVDAVTLAAARQEATQTAAGAKYGVQQSTPERRSRCPCQVHRHRRVRFPLPVTPR